MSLILKGIDLPKEVETIEVIFRCEEDASLYSIRELLEPTQAIQIPKGARLIDANKLELRRCDDSASRATFDYVDEWDLEDAPTILESEEEE